MHDIAANPILKLLPLLTLTAALLLNGCSSGDAVKLPTGPQPSGTQISGVLTGQLGTASSPYWVTDDLIVPEGESLTIAPGVELRFDGLHSLIVKGHLEAVGDAQNNIVFTSMSGALGSGDFGQWRSIIFDNGADESKLSYCLIQFGASTDTLRYPDSTGMFITGAVFIWDSSPQISHCTIVKNGYNGILCAGAGSTPNILNTNLYENDGDGIRCENGSAPQIWYTNSYENNSLQWSATPSGIGVDVQINENTGDSCDAQFNTSLDPLFLDFNAQDYTLTSCSHLIEAGQDKETIGSIPYLYPYGDHELRGPIGGKVITAGDPWYVSCNAFVSAGTTLTIQNGALILLEGFYGIRISGALEMEGATIIPRDSTNLLQKWYGITFQQGSGSASYIRNSRFVAASTLMNSEPFGGAITLLSVSPEITGNTFERNEYTAISCLNGSQPEIGYNVMDGFGPEGINCFNNSRPYIHHNVIRNGNGYGIYCDLTSAPVIESNLIYKTDLYGIKCSTQSSPQIEYTTITQCGYGGIHCVGQSNPTLRNNIIAYNYTSNTLSSHGTGILAASSSFPAVTYNDVVQPEGADFERYVGVVLDSTNISADPLFVDAAGGDFHLQSGSPAKTASNTGGEIGAYGKDSNW